MMRANDGTRTGGEILIDQLVVHGVQHVFCVPGESYLAALDAFYDRPINLTVCRQEGGAAMMAEAVGKVTGRPGICFVHARAGRHQRLARHPHRQAGFHADDRVRRPGRAARCASARRFRSSITARCSAPWRNGRPRSTIPARIPEIVSRAFYTACNGRPGPVVIALPEDMLIERVAVPDAPAFEPVETWPGLTDMARLQKMLWAAKPPIVLVGGSRWSEAATAALARFAERFAVPVATTFRRTHLFDTLHPCYAGDFGIGPNPKLLARVKASDLILLIGGRMGEMPSQSYTLLDIPEPRQTFVHVHPGAEELGRVYHPHLAINAAPTALCRGARRLAAAERDRVARARPRPRMPTISPGPRRRRRSPAASISARSWCGCATICPTDAIITNGAGNFSAWVHRFYRFRKFAHPDRADPPARWATACRRRSA